MPKTVTSHLFILFFLISSLLSGEKLIKIDKLNTLKNYDEIWNIETERIIDPVTSIRRSEEPFKVEGESKPFTGVAVLRERSRIKGLYFYTDGKEDKVFRYFRNGKLESYVEYNNGKKHGEEKLYNERGKLKSYRQNLDNITVARTDYYDDGSVLMEYKSSTNTRGTLVYYHKGTSIPSSSQEVRQKYSYIEGTTFVKDGETKYYNRKGNLESVFMFKNGKMKGLPQKSFYPDGQLKVYTIAGNDDLNNLKASEQYIEYHENGEKKYSCKEFSNDWRCEEYDKSGTPKGNRTAPALKKGGSITGEFFSGLFLYLILDTLIYEIFN